MSEGIPVMWMRGGTSKGAFFLAEDLPQDKAERDRVLLEIMGSPDPAQIDGMGGANPLTSKVAVVQKSQRPGIDVDYLFLQVMVDQPVVTDAQNCGNILAGVGPFSIERGLVAAEQGETRLRVFMVNSGQVATLRVQTPGGRITYAGEGQIDGVPGTAAPVPILFEDTAGSSCGALFPTGNVRDVIEGIYVTMIDNGMPVVLLCAADIGIVGDEAVEVLEANEALKAKLEEIRLQAGPSMNLGDVADKTVPKMTIVSPAQNGGTINTRSFIPHRCHKSIGVLGAVSVATAAMTPGAIGFDIARQQAGARNSVMIEHPSGNLQVLAERDGTSAPRYEILRTARKLMDGVVFARS